MSNNTKKKALSKVGAAKSESKAKAAKAKAKSLWKPVDPDNLPGVMVGPTKDDECKYGLRIYGEELMYESAKDRDGFVAGLRKFGEHVLERPRLEIDSLQKSVEKLTAELEDAKGRLADLAKRREKLKKKLTKMKSAGSVSASEAKEIMSTTAEVVN